MPEPRDLPLFRWGAELRAARLLRRQRLRLLACGLAGVVALAVASLLPRVPLLVWNVSASAPRGLYGVLPGAVLDRGMMVVARTPAAVRALAAERHYLPANVPLVKRVAALPGDRVCARGRWIYVRYSAVAHRQTHDHAGRAMPWWRGCRPLGKAEYLLLMPADASFDGRYFGPVTRTNILGRAVPLWTE
ncbi:S26 family signal peptidase [Sphingomonas sp. HF-S4]|uniref:S26 family signal peptidase n=1 Tax=Sphingomonas agrestis TaxID=3080540 RepID=A0ABU3Y391_9SPHN|nr:S26 family signal peptidase [Sphingomonas sp. HF-S4]MDV3455868.1 S26 family signal peptidase [Sphingomonas sp. HF-S4]